MASLGILSNNVVMKERFTKRVPRSDLLAPPNAAPREFAPPVQARAEDVEAPSGDAWAGIVDRRMDYTERKVKQLEESIRAPPSTRCETGREGCDLHWVFGLARRCPLTIPMGADCTYEKTLARYQKAPASYDMVKMGSRKWYLLYYPMEEVQLGEGHRQFFMRCKTVDRDTGQLSWHLMKVYETLGESESRTFKRFAMHPSL